MKEKIGILLSVYNGDKVEFVKLAINSILNQTYTNYFLFIGVDGPISDDLNKCLLSFKFDKRVKIIRYKENRGLTKVLNDLLGICFEYKLNYIARMDADDISLPHRIAKQLEYMLNNPNIDVVGGAIEEIDEMGNSYGKVIHYPLDHKSCYKFFKRRDPLAHPAVLFRNTFFKKAGLYNKEYIKNQDTVLWLEGFKNGCKFANLEDIVLKFRMDSFFFRKRRGGFKRAKELLLIRIKVSKELNYGIIGILYAIILFSITIAPTFIRKITYKYLR